MANVQILPRRVGASKAIGDKRAATDGAKGARVEAESERFRDLSVAQLRTAIERELIPRLLVAHSGEMAAPERPGIRPEPLPAGEWAAHDEVVRFAAWSAAGEDERLREHVSELLSVDVGLDALYLHLFAPAARHLGEQWSRDEVSFVDVQLGLSHLHRLVCECGPIGFQREQGELTDTRSILLTAVPGEQHTFGVTLAADFFRRHGWRVSNLCGHGYDFVTERLASTDYTAVGFSMVGDGDVPRLGRAIGELRRRSANPNLLVLVGGDFFVRHPEQVERVGADLSAIDAHRAVVAAENALPATSTTPA